MTDRGACLVCGGDGWDLLSHVGRYGLEFDVCVCTGCGFVMQAPPLPEATLAAYYADRYNETGYKMDLEVLHEAMMEPCRRRCAYLDRFEAVPRAGRVLEIGPGAGSMLKLLHDRGCRVVGVEADPAAADWLRETHGWAIHRGMFEDVYPAMREAWAAEPFDLVVLVHVFEHIADAPAFLARLADIVAPEARLFIEVPNVRRPYSDEREWAHFCDPGHLYYFSVTSLAAVLARSGIVVDDITDDTMRPYRNIACVGRFAGADGARAAPRVCDPPHEIARIWTRFVRGHPVNWYMRYGWKRDVKSALGLGSSRPEVR